MKQILSNRPSYNYWVKWTYKIITIWIPTWPFPIILGLVQYSNAYIAALQKVLNTPVSSITFESLRSTTEQEVRFCFSSKPLLLDGYGYYHNYALGSWFLQTSLRDRKRHRLVHRWRDWNYFTRSACWTYIHQYNRLTVWESEALRSLLLHWPHTNGFFQSK